MSCCKLFHLVDYSHFRVQVFITLEMSLYYSPSQPRQMHTNFSSNTDPGTTLRVTCVNVNHVTYNYLMENASPSTVESAGYNYGNGCGGSLPCYQSLTSALQQPQDSSGGVETGSRPFSLPSSCESPMSLPAFSPPTNQSFIHHNPSHYQQQPFPGTNLFHEEIPQITSSGSSAMDEFNLDEEFSLDLAGSDDDGTTYFLLLLHNGDLTLQFSFRGI